MLTLTNIKKDYFVGEMTVPALKGVSIEFRDNEFVSVLGPSGCGKTTLLNIIGGLDRYTQGDLVIGGKSTKSFKDRDWDNYRNHSVGFIFQSYNLIPHQTVLANVELALTLSGVSKAQRKKRAADALAKVGLDDQLTKKPNQLSGGQMQRVAIARALVNDPDILLADEPTGALDSETSVQIMELLKEIAKDRLVIMVTHNPELADQYSTRIIRLLDGEVIDDSAPYTHDEEKKENQDTVKKHPSMSFLTALSLSLNNLMTKKARTFLTSFAGSIGIIGIALILSLQSGVDAYIQKVEEETLSSYPVMIEGQGMDLTNMITDLMKKEEESVPEKEDVIYSHNIMTDMLSTMSKGFSKNNLERLKKHIEKTDDFKKYAGEIEYRYSTVMNIYDESGKQINPNTVVSALRGDTDASAESGNNNSMMGASMRQNAEVWNRLFDNTELLKKQYTVLDGNLPKNYDEIVVVVDKNHRISDFTLYSLGLKDSAELEEMVNKFRAGEKIKEPKQTSYSFDEILKLKFKLLINTDYYTENKDGTWSDHSKEDVYVRNNLLKNAIELKVVGILAPKEDAAVDNTYGFVGYQSDLMEHLINKINDSKIVKAQKKQEETDIFTGKPFDAGFDNMNLAQLEGYIAQLPEEQQGEFQGYIMQMQQQGTPEEEIVKTLKDALKKQLNTATLEGNLEKMGVADLNIPSAIYIYPKDFEAKEKITDLINHYNDKAKEENKITYTDYIGLMLSSVTTIINAISYILIAFVSISLNVSSIMIGIITYISVLERTKEIGILRAMGASKRDISRVFNAETLIVGFAAGAIGILLTLLLLIPINAIITAITEISGLAVLPPNGGVVLVLISMLLTFIAGLIPAKIAAKKDPVTALRTE